MQATSEEAALIEAFVVPSKRKRYVSFLDAPKKRKKLINELRHFRDLDPDCLVEINPSDYAIERIYDRLRERGAGAHCHAISSHPNIDGRRLPLIDALTEVVFMGGGTLLSCVSGRLGYFEGEHPKDRYILARHAR